MLHRVILPSVLLFLLSAVPARADAISPEALCEGRAEGQRCGESEDEVGACLPADDCCPGTFGNPEFCNEDNVCEPEDGEGEGAPCTQCLKCDSSAEPTSCRCTTRPTSAPALLAAVVALATAIGVARRGRQRPS